MPISAADLFEGARARVGLNFDDGRLQMDTNPFGVLFAINAGVQEFSLIHDWDFLYVEGTIAVVAGTETYAVPANYLRTGWLAINNREITARQRRDAIQFYGQQGMPAYYDVTNGLIRLTPVPSAAATMRHGYFKTLPEVTDPETDTFDIPTEFLGLCTLYVAKQIMLMLKDQDGYNSVVTAIALERKTLDDNARREQQPGRPRARIDVGYGY